MTKYYAKLLHNSIELSEADELIIIDGESQNTIIDDEAFGIPFKVGITLENSIEYDRINSNQKLLISPEFIKEDRVDSFYLSDLPVTLENLLGRYYGDSVNPALDYIDAVRETL